MPTLLAPLALIAAQAAAPAAPTPTPPPKLTLEQSTALKCGVAFALVDKHRQAGSPTGATYPALGERGLEFFVRSAARIMDETGADREAIAGLAKAAAGELAGSPDRLNAVMPACLLLLDASGL